LPFYHSIAGNTTQCSDLSLGRLGKMPVSGHKSV